MILKLSNPVRWSLTLVTIAFALLGSSSGLRAIAHDGPHDDDKPMGVTNAEPPHSHTSLEIPAGQPVPTVRLSVVPDAKRGWNLEAKVTNFRFAPERVNTKSLAPNEGHAHLMIDGQQVTRLYSSWYYLGSLPPGKHTIEVTLNSNSHESLTRNGKPISASTTIEVPSR